MFVRLTVWPDPSDGVTGFGEYVTGGVTGQLAGLERVVRVEQCRPASSASPGCPRNCWLQETFIEPALAVVPVVGREIVAGGEIVKSGIVMTLPG